MMNNMGGDDDGDIPDVDGMDDVSMKILAQMSFVYF